MENVLRDEPSRIDANGNKIDTYPEQFRGADRIGINFAGRIEYFSDDCVYELAHGVKSDTIESLNVHNKLGQTPEQHVKNSSRRFGRWWYVEV